MNIGIFCSANDLEPRYTAPAQQLATLLAAANHTLVWGGSNYGLMKVIADGVQSDGGKLIGVSMELFKQYARRDADEMIIAKNLGERKAILLDRSDSIVVLVGGLGTLDELSEVLELKKQGYHDKPIIVLNTAGFYDGLKQQLERMANEGFLPIKEQEGIRVRPLSELIQFADSPEQIMALIGADNNGTATMEVLHN